MYGACCNGIRASVLRHWWLFFISEGRTMSQDREGLNGEYLGDKGEMVECPHCKGKLVVFFSEWFNGIFKEEETRPCEKS